jgi:site-specific DNA recombinase
MERRCAIYPRYSSDLQRKSSNEDQVRNYRRFAEQQGDPVVPEFTAGEEESSGESMEGRPVLRALLAAAKRRPRPFDCVLVDDTSRLARNLSDALRIIEIFKYNGVDVVSVTQGIDTAQDNARTLLTIHGMMDEQYLVGLRQKVHRGQEGRVLKGFNPGGRCYGYKNVPIEDPTRTGKYGRPAVLGVRQEINESEAAVVRRIFALYASGLGLAPIAYRLNEEGVPAPEPSRNRRRQAWSRYTVREMLFNEKYRGVVVWNRTQKARDPETGRKVSKARPANEWTRVEVPELRIVSEDLWVAAHKRNAEVNRLGIARMGGLCRTQKSRTYLFSGLLACGLCQSNMVIVSGGGKRGYVKYGCHTHKHAGVCANNWTIRRDRLEEQLLAEIEQRVFQPGVIDYLIKRCEDELQRRLKEIERQGKSSSLETLRRNRDNLKAQAARLTEAIEVGGDLPSLVQRLGTVEAELGRLEGAILTHRPSSLKVRTEKIREQVLNTITQLRTKLDGAEVGIARSALLKHMKRLVLMPVLKDGKKLFRVSGNVSLVPEAEGGMLLVARDGIEPPTPAFSGPPTEMPKWSGISGCD